MTWSVLCYLIYWHTYALSSHFQSVMRVFQIVAALLIVVCS